MVQIFMTSLLIHKVRHLENITIPLAEDSVKHLILTGKNGSGKTSVLEALADFLNDSLFLDQSLFKRVLAYSHTKRALFSGGGRCCSGWKKNRSNIQLPVRRLYYK